jgi:hypothetical protein
MQDRGLRVGTRLLLRIAIKGMRHGMGTGAGILIIVIGAILVFAVDWSIGGLDLHVVGWILMAAGVAGPVVFFYLWNRRRAPAAVAAVRQQRITDMPHTDETSTLPPVTTVTTVTATAPVVTTSLDRPHD